MRYSGRYGRAATAAWWLALILAVCLSSSAWAADITVASFNIRIYSTGSRDDTELGLIADRLQQFDLIAIQELRDEEGTGPL